MRRGFVSAHRDRVLDPPVDSDSGHQERDDRESRQERSLEATLREVGSELLFQRRHPIDRRTPQKVRGCARAARRFGFPRWNASATRYVYQSSVCGRHDAVFHFGQELMNRRTTARLLALASCLWIAGSTPDAQSRSLGITHVSVIDATGSVPKRDQTVVVTGDRIVAIGASNRVRVPAGAELFDGTGKFVIPGLWDMHVHLGAYEDGRKTLLRLLASGITGVRDMASPLDDILRLRQDAEAGTVASPSGSLNGSRKSVAGDRLTTPPAHRVAV